MYLPEIDIYLSGPLIMSKNILVADDDKTIATTFTFRKGSFDGERKEYNPTGYVRNELTNAEWGMQFIWPIKADYRIIYLTDDYSQTIIGRNKRDYVWIMARTPEIPAADPSPDDPG